MRRRLIDFKEILGREELLVAEFFKGYGSQSMSLDAIGVPNKVIVGSEIDTDAIISYASARHTQEELDKKIELTDEEIKEWLIQRNIGWDSTKQKSSIPRMKKSKLYKLYNACILDHEWGDISLINPNDLPNFDLMTYSFPCTDISVAGKMQGLKKGQTRSGLLWECEKIIEVKKPKYLLMENVKNLVGKKFKGDFDKWCEWLESQGYTNYWKIMNAKDYGVPQNRERVFMVSILGEHDTYKFPQKQELKLRLKDILEDEVDEKYYIDSDSSQKLLSQLKDKNSIILDMCQAKREGSPREYSDISPCLSARDYKEPRLVNEGSDKIVWEQCSDGETSRGLILYDNLSGGKWDKIHESSKRVYSDVGLAPTVNTCSGGNIEPKVFINKKYRIRKLTPRECWRLMGVDDEVFDKVCASGISNSQLYKQAGNSIVRKCLDEIFLKLFFKN